MRENQLEALSIEPALRSDGRAISTLIESLTGPFFTPPEHEGAEQFLVSISEAAIESYLSSERYCYIVACSQSKVVGVAALRDNTHLFHLFVAEAFQKHGIGRNLWSVLRRLASEHGNNGIFTVNSSLNAVPVYEALGFIAEGVVVTTRRVVSAHALWCVRSLTHGSSGLAPFEASRST